MLILANEIDTKGLVLFKEKRVGVHKSHFQILKFGTLRIGTPANLLNNSEQYITNVGRFLRKSSLDNLIQIINTIRVDGRR